MSLSYTGYTDLAHRAVLQPAITRAIWSPDVCEKGQRVELMVWTSDVPDGHTLDLSVVKLGWRPETFKPKGFPAQLTVQRGVGTASWKADFDDPAFDTYNHLSLRFEARSASLPGVAFTSVNALEVGQPAVSVRWMAENFAPKSEGLGIQYTVYDRLGKARSAVLRIYGNRYNGASYPAAGALVYEERLAEDQFSSGRHVFEWRGHSTCTSGPLQRGPGGATRFIHPLCSPYVVEIELSRTAVPANAAWPASGTIRSFAAPENFHGARLKKDGSGVAVVDGDGPPELGGFEVLYHSLELGQGDPLFDGKVPTRTGQKNRWGLYLLDLLGYHAGPVDGPVAGDDAKIALRRFQHRHYKPNTPDAQLPITGALDADTEGALAKTWYPRPAFQRFRKPFVEDCKIFFDDNFGYNEKDDRTVTFNLSDFLANNRPVTIEAKYFNRGWVPVAATVFLKGRQGGPVRSPEGVGDVRVCFEFEEPDPEDALIILPRNPKALQFVTRARAYLGAPPAGNVEGAYNTAGAPVHNNSGNNCSDQVVNGFRDDDPAKYIKVVFEGADKLKPFTVQFAQRTEAGKTIQFAWTKACVDDRYPPWLGRGGIYWRPSCKGGDGYVVKARLSFENEPNQALLEQRHRSARGLNVTGARFRVWRLSRIASYIHQNVRAGFFEMDWDVVAEEYRQGYVAFERGCRPWEDVDYPTYVTEADYKNIAAAATGNPVANIVYNAHYVFGLAIPPQNAGESSAAYKTRLRNLVKPFIDPLVDPLSEHVRGQVRKKEPEGYILMDVRPLPPLNMNKSDGTPDPDSQGWLMQGTALGRCDYQVWMIDSLDYPVQMLFPHEMGHCRIFWHGRVYNDASGNPQYGDKRCHDLDAIDFCTMSYATVDAAGDPVATHDYYPDFCGKCVLKLRGWDERSLPRRYA
ncbi:MAG TPA: hypothetical protein VMS93_12890 [Candidatus Saccharimonadales bacterium]|nr:hypothetical protein [Candidatus Saccharimonadales bacterium]